MKNKLLYILFLFLFGVCHAGPGSPGLDNSISEGSNLEWTGAHVFDGDVTFSDGSEFKLLNSTWVINDTNGVIITTSTDGLGSVLLSMDPTGIRVGVKKRVPLTDFHVGGSSLVDSYYFITESVPPPSAIPGFVILFSSGVAGTAEAFVMDGAGNITQLSAHGFQLYDPDQTQALPIQFRYSNVFTGEAVEIDMMRLANDLEALTGKKYIHESSVAPTERKSWNAVQEKKRIEVQEEIADQINRGIPPRAPYVKKDPPGWLRDRLINKGISYK